MRHGLGYLALALYLGAVIAALTPDRDRHGPRPAEPGDTGQACPLCGGGPVVTIIGGAQACRSCARVVTTPRAKGDRP